MFDALEHPGTWFPPAQCMRHIFLFVSGTMDCVMCFSACISALEVHLHLRGMFDED